MVEHALDRRAPEVVAFTDAGLFSGVSAQQVVEGITARSLFGEQVRAGQFGQQGAGMAGRDAGQVGCGGCADAGAGVQAQRPEQPGGAGAQGAVGPGEYCPDVGGGVTAVKGVQRNVGLAQRG